MRDNYTIVLVHLHKCGGTALKKGIIQNYKQHNFEQYYNFHILPHHEKYFYNLPEAKQKKIRFIHGHFIEQYTFEYLNQIVQTPYSLITLVRYPVDRVVSSYYYYRATGAESDRNPISDLCCQYTFEQILDPSLKNQLDHYHWIHLNRRINNYMVRVLSGAAYTDPKKDRTMPKMTARHLEQAISNLDRFYSFVGTQNKLDSYWKIISDKFCWPYPSQHFFDPEKRPNVNKSRPSSNQLSDDITEKILNQNQLDLALYQWVLQNEDKINSRPLVEINESTNKPMSFSSCC